MKGIKKLVVLVILVAAAMAAWQIGGVEWNNIQFQQDLEDVATSTTYGVSNMPPNRDPDHLREVVISKAKDHGIDLKPDQVTVKSGGAAMNTPMYLSADYTVPVNLLAYQFDMHFQPSSTKTGF
jgi:hypothetical protein